VMMGMACRIVKARNDDADPAPSVRSNGTKGEDQAANFARADFYG